MKFYFFFHLSYLTCFQVAFVILDVNHELISSMEDFAFVPLLNRNVSIFLFCKEHFFWTSDRRYIKDNCKQENAFITIIYVQAQLVVDIVIVKFSQAFLCEWTSFLIVTLKNMSPMIEDKRGFSFEAPHWSASFGLIDFPLKDDIKITHR